MHCVFKRKSNFNFPGTHALDTEVSPVHFVNRTSCAHSEQALESDANRNLECLLPCVSRSLEFGTRVKIVSVNIRLAIVLLCLSVVGWGKSVCMPCVCVEVSGPLPGVRAFPLYHVGCRDQMWVIRSASKYPLFLSHLASPNILLFQARKIWRPSALGLSSSLTHSLENRPGVTNDQLSLVLSFKFESGKMHIPC